MNLSPKGKLIAYMWVFFGFLYKNKKFLVDKVEQNYSYISLQIDGARGVILLITLSLSLWVSWTKLCSSSPPPPSPYRKHNFHSWVHSLGYLYAPGPFICVGRERKHDERAKQRKSICQFYLINIFCLLQLYIYIFVSHIYIICFILFLSILLKTVWQAAAAAYN